MSGLVRNPKDRFFYERDHESCSYFGSFRNFKQTKTLFISTNITYEHQFFKEEHLSLLSKIEPHLDRANNRYAQADLGNRNTIKFLNFQTPEKFAVIYQKSPNLRVFHQKDVIGIANREDPLGAV